METDVGAHGSEAAKIESATDFSAIFETYYGRILRYLDDCDECRAHLDLDRELATALATLTPRRGDARVRTLRTRTWTAIERCQMANDPDPGAGKFGRVVSTSLGLAAIGVAIVLLIALGKPILDERAASTELPIAPNHLLLSTTVTANDGPVVMRPVDLSTLDDLPEYRPLEMGHHFTSALSSDGKTLAVLSWPSGSNNLGAKLQLIDVASWTTTPSDVTVNDSVDLFTFGADARNLYWAIPVGHEASHLMPVGYALEHYDVQRRLRDVVARLPDGFVPWDARLLRSENRLAIYGVPTNSENLAVDAPHLLMVDLATGRISTDLRLGGLKAGQYSETDPATGQPTYRMYGPGKAWDLVREWLYVASPDTDRVVVVDLARGTIIRQGDVHPAASLLNRLLHWLIPSVEAKGGPSTMRVAELSPDGQRLYLVRTGEAQTWSMSGLEVVDTSDLSLIAHLDLPASDLALSPDGQRLLLRLSWPDAPESPAHTALAVLDARQLAELGRMAVDGPVSLLGFSPDGRDAYVARNVERPDKSWEWRISVVDVAARRVLAERGFSGSGAPAFVSFVGIWRSGSWQQGP